MFRSVTYEIDDEVYKKFKIALLISGETEAEVIHDLMRSYTKTTYIQAADKMPGGKHTATRNQTGNKAVGKIPIWAMRPKQINHQILKAFLVTRDEESGRADKSEMWEEFSKTNPQNYSSFANNFNSMLTDSGNSHGKTFECTGDYVELYEPVKEVVAEYESYFKG